MPALGHPRDLAHGFVVLVQVAAENEVCQQKKKTGPNRVVMRSGLRCWIPPRSKKVTLLFVSTWPNLQTGREFLCVENSEKELCF